MYVYFTNQTYLEQWIIVDCKRRTKNNIFFHKN